MPFILTSLTRITNLQSTHFEVRPLSRERWDAGDYVGLEVTDAGSGEFRIELPDGRMMEVLPGDRLIGALGVRHATLEATGSWRAAGSDGLMQVLTGAGLLGGITSKSRNVPTVIAGRYLGHVLTGGHPARMRDYVPDVEPRPFELPVALLFGSSMSAGKTTAGRVIVRELRSAGLRVVALKLTGAGRYKDILALRDAGAEAIYDFVDAGLPSTVCSAETFEPALQTMLRLAAGAPADVAVIELGASPLEPYNGERALEAIREHVQFSVLCTTDPYAALGLIHSFDLRPDIISGPATNTIAGCELIERLCDVRALNILDPAALPELRRLLAGGGGGLSFGF
jgi:hypothetical protein